MCLSLGAKCVVCPAVVRLVFGFWAAPVSFVSACVAGVLVSFVAALWGGKTLARIIPPAVWCGEMSLAAPGVLAIIARTTVCLREGVWEHSPLVPVVGLPRRVSPVVPYRTAVCLR